MPAPTSITTYQAATLPNGVKMHYASNGSDSLPTLLLLHGFPTSSIQFRNLIPLLAATGKYRIIAPDLPSFGLTTLPPSVAPEQVTFDYLSQSLEQFVDKIGLSSFVMYIFDFGAPTGLRLALRRPELIKGIITQNGNAYLEGLGEKWDPIRAWWKTPSESEEHTATGNSIRDSAFSFEGNLDQYTQGVPEQYLPRIDPYLSNIDYALNLATPEGKARQLSLFWDYRTNIEMYPAFHKYFRDTNVPILAVWGKGDGYFIPAGGEAFKRDSKNVQVVIIDGSHFLLETHLYEVYSAMIAWLPTVI